MKSIEEQKLESTIKSLLTEKEIEEIKEKAKEKEEGEDTERKKKGFLIALNKKFIFFKKGNMVDNVMDIEEAKKLIEGLKAVAKASGAEIEEGFTSIKIGKCTIELVHTDVVKESPQLNLSNTQSKPLNSCPVPLDPLANDYFLPCGFPKNLIIGGCAGCATMHKGLCPKYSPIIPPVSPMPGVPNF